jgi:hypothetical protein
MGIMATLVERVQNSEPATIVIKSVNLNYKNYERGTEEVAISAR